MKKITAIIVAILMCAVLFSLTAGAADDVSVWNGSEVNKIANGTGTENDPFVITNAAELDYMARACMGGETFEGKFIKLGVNVDWAGKEWTSIGYSTTTVFSGNFDGNGKTIFNLTCQDVAVGIFAYATNATIKNLNVDYATFTTDTRYAGAIVALARGCSISGCSAGEDVVVKTTDIMSNTAQMGGLFGLVNSSNVTECTFYGNVSATSITGTSFVGGIAGVIGNNSEVSYCINHGNVEVPNASTAEGKHSYAGGITGGLGSSSVVGVLMNCINYGTINSVDFAGGIIGRFHVKASTMTECYNVGTVVAPAGLAGSLVGEIPVSAELSANVGVASADVKAAYAAIADGVTVSDDALRIDENSGITSLATFEKIEKTVADAMPEFADVTPGAAPTETTPAETTPAETTPAETTPAETTPAETAPVETTPAETTRVDTPVDSQKPNDTTTAPEKSGGCGSALPFGIMMLATLSAGAVVMGKKRK